MDKLIAALVAAYMDPEKREPAEKVILGVLELAHLSFPEGKVREVLGAGVAKLRELEKLDDGVGR